MIFLKAMIIRVGVLYLLLCLGARMICPAQSPVLANVKEAFDNIPASPVVKHFKNLKFKVPTGGHLQGIQGWPGKAGEQMIITSSSGSVSYDAVVSMSD